MPLMMQLLNPSFCNAVKVYHDPYSKEPIMVDNNGFPLQGNAKSYFIKVGDDDVAIKLMAKKYSKDFNPLWNDCNNVINKYRNIKWMDLEKHILEYSRCQ